MLKIIEGAIKNMDNSETLAILGTKTQDEEKQNRRNNKYTTQKDEQHGPIKNQCELRCSQRVSSSCFLKP